MRRYQCALFAAVIVIGVASVASAADMPVKAPMMAPAYNWTGWYVGANVGGGWGSRDVSFVANDPAAAFVFGAGLPSTSSKTSGLIGGLQVGYNWQPARNWLFGVETDFDWSGMKGSASSTNPASFGSPVATVDEKINWFGTVRGRLGYLPADNLLTYITGGFAYGQVKHSGNYNYSPGFGSSSTGGGFSVACGILAPPGGQCFAGSSSSVATGWTLGGGLEYAFSQKWTVKAEYLYVSLAAKSLTETAQAVITPGVPPGSINANFSRTNFNVARIGVNYRF